MIEPVYKPYVKIKKEHQAMKKKNKKFNVDLSFDEILKKEERKYDKSRKH